ncbi:MAG: hypothetical protein H0V29_03870 [Thermoleophilaceae bacterium]|nr:hypothetical protein [Thermoleophilaceae bacterium]
MVNWTQIVEESPGGGDFLKKEDKDRMYLEQIAFAIVNTRPRIDTTFGDQTHYIVRLADARDTDRTLAFSHNSYREGTANTAQGHIDAGNGPIGPCYLRKFQTKTGNEAWELSGEPLDPKPGSSKPTNGGQGSPAVVGDDLPF